LDIELSGVNLSKEEDALFKLFEITDDLAQETKPGVIKMEQYTFNSSSSSSSSSLAL
jgi:hypothetical protein